MDPRESSGGVECPLHHPKPSIFTAHQLLHLSPRWVSVEGARESFLGTKEFRILAPAWEGAVHDRALRDG